MKCSRGTYIRNVFCTHCNGLNSLIEALIPYGKKFSRVKNFVDCLKTALVSNFRNFVVVREIALVSKLLKINKFQGINFRGRRKSPKTTKVFILENFLP